MEIQPIVDEGLGNAAWLVDLQDARAMVVEPSRDPSPCLDLARAKRLQIAFSVETHLHAYFVSGSRELTTRGAELLALARRTWYSRTAGWTTVRSWIWAG